MENLNFKEKIDHVNKEITSWKKRNLTTLGKITVVKTLLLPKFTHLFTSLPKPSHETIKKLESIFFNFIWNDKRDRVARKILCQDKAKGGCRMVKIDTYIKGLKLTWMRRIFQRNQNYKWVQLFFDITDIEEKYLTVDPSPILGLASAPIVETKFLELAMSLLDFSHRIPLGTFSILLNSLR